MSSPSFFRKSALEKLSTPEKLDQLIQITSSRSWIALLTIGLVIFTAVTWSVFGRVKTKIDTAGMLLGGEVYDIVSTSQGQLVDLNVNVGDYVKEGDIIAVVDQPEIAQQIELVKASLVERQYELKQQLAFGSKDSQIQEKLIEQQRISTKQQIQTYKNNIAFLEQQLATERDLLEKGLITKPQVIDTEQQLENAQNQIESLKAQLVQMASQELNAGFDLEQKTNLIQQRIAEEERRLQQLEEQFATKTSIKSPYSGEVVEVLTNAGIVIGLGAPLFKVKNGAVAGKVRGVLYVPSQDGKKIEEGMDALVVPSTVQPQEFGYMKAKVTYVSDFPITQQGMMTSMKNDQLVRGLLEMGAPFEIHVEFEQNTDAFSGYAWTSATGPEILINAGTSCEGKITVKEEPPIAMVLPALKKFFDLY